MELRSKRRSSRFRIHSKYGFVGLGAMSGRLTAIGPGTRISRVPPTIGPPTDCSPTIGPYSGSARCGVAEVNGLRDRQHPGKHHSSIGPSSIDAADAIAGMGPGVPASAGERDPVRLYAAALPYEAMQRHEDAR